MKLLGRKDEAKEDEQPGGSPEAGQEAPEPQPERHEPKHPDPGPTDLSKRDYLAILRRSVKESLADQVTSFAAAIAYHVFLSIP